MCSKIDTGKTESKVEDLVDLREVDSGMKVY